MAKPRSSAALIAVVVVVLALAGWMVSKQLRPDAAGRADSAGDATTAQSAEPAGGAPASASPAARPTRAAPDFREQLALLKDPAKMKARREQELAALEAQHQAESRDPVWAAKTEQAYGEIAESKPMQDVGVTPKNLQADCRSSTCRITADFGNAGNAQDWATFFLTSSGGLARQAKVIVVPNADGTSQVRIFSMRR